MASAARQGRITGIAVTLVLAATLLASCGGGETAAPAGVFTGKGSLPDWIGAAGVQTWVNGQGSVLVHPTDATFVTLWSARVAALGRRYAADDTVVQITICGPTGSLCGPRYPELPAGDLLAAVAANVRIGPFAEFLSDVAPAAGSTTAVAFAAAAAGRDWCGFQMVSPLSGKVADAVLRGRSFGCNYFEIYGGDLHSQGSVLGAL